MKLFTAAIVAVGLVTLGSGLASTSAAVAAGNGSAVDTIAKLEAKGITCRSTARRTSRYRSAG